MFTLSLTILLAIVCFVIFVTESSGEKGSRFWSLLFLLCGMVNTVVSVLQLMGVR